MTQWPIVLLMAAVPTDTTIWLSGPLCYWWLQFPQIQHAVWLSGLLCYWWLLSQMQLYGSVAIQLPINLKVYHLVGVVSQPVCITRASTSAYWELIAASHSMRLSRPVLTFAQVHSKLLLMMSAVIELWIIDLLIQWVTNEDCPRLVRLSMHGQPSGVARTQLEHHLHLRLWWCWAASSTRRPNLPVQQSSEPLSELKSSDEYVVHGPWASAEVQRLKTGSTLHSCFLGRGVYIKKLLLLLNTLIEHCIE